MKKLNCWEFKKCGREVNGKDAKTLGVCPASLETKLEGVHEGTKAGRSCWVVVGTLCKGEVQGSFAMKFHNCQQCDFYLAVKNEEGAHFKLSATILAMLRQA
jgi:hypothetical protein